MKISKFAIGQLIETNWLFKFLFFPHIALVQAIDES